MAHFSYLSSPESDNSAVEDIISQAKDLSVLEQIAALNSPHSSLLPAHLETRFNRLKSLPPSLPTIDPHNLNTSTCQNQPIKTPTSSPPPPLNPHNFNASTSQNQPMKTPTSFPLSPEKSEKPKDPDLNSGSGYVSSPSISFSQPLRPPPPPLVEPPSSPPQVCCFGCSPKKLRKKKIRKDWAADLNLDDEFWGKDDEILSDLGAFSLKEQQQKLKKAWKEEAKVAREAEKIVKWAREVSARMEASAIEDLTTDDEKFN